LNMITLLKIRLLWYRLTKKETKRALEERRSRIAYCLRNSDIRMEDLIPIPDEEYVRVVARLEEKVKLKKADEPSEIRKDFLMPDGSTIYNYPLPNIFAWRDILSSMTSRRKDAYYIKHRPCRKCGEDNIIYFCYRSSRESWKQLCGREGYMLICPDCLTILSFVPYIMN